MKVLFLTNIPSPYRVSFFQKLGEECDLTVLYELHYATDRDKRWKSEKGKKTYKEIYLNPIIKFSSSALCPGVKKYLKDRKFDVVVIGGYSTPTGMYAIQYLKRKKIPYILNCDGGKISYGEKRLKYNLKKYFISEAAAYLSTGNECKRYLIYYGAEGKKIYDYPFTSIHEKEMVKVPVELETKQCLRKRLGIKEQKIAISVGSFIRRKGFDILLIAANKISRDFGIYIIGGEATSEYKNLIKQYALTNVHFLPFMNKEELNEYYLAADLFILPTREDIWGLVVNEAMAAGLPVITTDACVAGLELVDNKCGKIVPAEDSDKLASAMEEFFLDDLKCLNAAREVIAKIQKYSIENMAQRHMQIFEEFLNCRKIM